jgi:hypothetical protein
MKMIFKQWITILVLTVFSFTSMPTFAFAARLEQTPLERITVAEQLVYGMEQTGSLVERTTKMEKELFGLPGREALMAKVERIYAYVRESSATEPSLVYKMNALEWSLTQSVAKGPAKTRLESLEKTVAGIVGQGSIDSRVSRLMTITFSGSKLQLGQASLAKDTLIKIKTVTPLDSKKNKTGDVMEFEVAEDVYAAGMLIIAKGAVGRGKLAKVDQAQNFGRDAKMEVNFETVEALDLTQVSTILGEKAKKETESTALAAGAGMAGMILLGPIGVVGAAFVHGKNITIPAGTQLYIQTQNDVELVGLVAK